jgi:hypothetical protein
MRIVKVNPPIYCLRKSRLSKSASGPNKPEEKR